MFRNNARVAQQEESMGFIPLDKVTAALKAEFQPYTQNA
jgi:hypothetical protein